MWRASRSVHRGPMPKAVYYACQENRENHHDTFLRKCRKCPFLESPSGLRVVIKNRRARGGRLKPLRQNPLRGDRF